MIILGRVTDVKNYKYDKCYIIVRSLRNKKVLNKPNTEWLPELAPLGNLFKWYLQAKNNGNWNKESFDKHYTEEFIKGLNEESKRLMNEILDKSNQGQIVLLACFCEDEELCHRSIIGGILQGMGAHVESTTIDEIDYTKYYKRFMDIRS